MRLIENYNIICQYKKSDSHIEESIKISSFPIRKTISKTLDSPPILLSIDRALLRLPAIIARFYKKKLRDSSFPVVELSSNFLAVNDFISFDISRIYLTQNESESETQRFMTEKNNRYAIATLIEMQFRQQNYESNIHGSPRVPRMRKTPRSLQEPIGPFSSEGKPVQSMSQLQDRNHTWR